VGIAPGGAATAAATTIQRSFRERARAKEETRERARELLEKKRASIRAAVEAAETNKRAKALGRVARARAEDVKRKAAVARGVLTSSMQSLTALSDHGSNSSPPTVASSAASNRPAAEPERAGGEPDVEEEEEEEEEEEPTLGGDFGRFLRDVAARVIQRYAKAWLAARQRAAEEEEEEEEETAPALAPAKPTGDSPMSEPRTRLPMPLSRLGATDAAEPPSGPPPPSPAARAAATLERNAVDACVAATNAALFTPPPRAANAAAPAPDADKLSSIMSYLDTVERDDDVPVPPVTGIWEQAAGASPSYPRVPAPPTPATAALVAHFASSAHHHAANSALTPSADGGASGALEAANTVYEGVRAKMEALKRDVERKEHVIAKLEVELIASRDRAAAEIAMKLAEQRNTHDAATSRHLNFADRLLADKDELSRKLAETGEALRKAESRAATTAAAIKKETAIEMKKLRAKWESEREAWEIEKTREVKELTIRGLEPEIQRLVTKHRNELRDAQDALREDLRRQHAALTSEHEESARGLKEKLAREHDDELERERAVASARSREQAERYETQLQELRLKVATAAAEERARHDETIARAARETAAAAEAARKRHDADLASLQDRLDEESATWRAKVTAKAQAALAEREREIRAKCAAERDAEIEAVASRLRAESDDDRIAQTDALVNRHATEAREAKYRADKAERALAAAARAEAAANDRAASLETQLADAMEKLKREGAIGGAFEERLKTLEGSAAAAERRAASAEIDLVRMRKLKDEEVAAIENRSRAATSRKDEAIALLNAQLVEARRQLAEAGR
jgi:5-azacytidine-induced protein 1